jgi:L-threonylcarbamoyladenylate synthase
MNIIPTQNINLDDIVSSLQVGDTIVYPTETCYGLGCDATNQEAVDKVFEIKKRQKDKPLLVIMPDVEMAMEYVEWNETLERIADRYWPGPVTVVAPLIDRDVLAEGVVAEDGTIAFRVTAHPFSYELSASLAKPLVSTSANISLQESPYDVRAVESMFEAQAFQPDIVIDAGELTHQSPSTIVKIVNGKVRVLRQGEVVVDL